MKIAIAQTNIIWEDKEKNIAAAETIIKEVAKENARIVLFPEMSFTGFSMNVNKTGEGNRDTVRRMSYLSEKYGVAVGFGWVRWRRGRYENVYSVVDIGGDIKSEYVKIHPFSFSGENERFIGGEKLTLFKLDGIPFSTFICYDLRFPEIFRMICDKAHVVIVPACWPVKRSEHWKVLLKARAIENQVYIVAINRVGEGGGLYYSGDSCVINPNGELKSLLTDKEGVLFYDYIDDVDLFRSSFPILKDRKIDLYRTLSIDLMDRA